MTTLRSVRGGTVARHSASTALASIALLMLSAMAGRAQVAGLVAAYGFNEASGTTVADVSGSNNTGTFNTGVTRAASGRFGGALVFNGTTGMVTIPNAASLGLTTRMTLEAWVNPSVVSSAWRDVIYKANDNYFLMATTPTSSRPAGGGSIGNGGPTRTYGTSALVVGTWTHLAVTYDGAAVRLYVNGVQVSSAAKTGNIATSTNALTIGGDALSSRFFQGMIDEVRVYNRALTVTEVQSDMNTAVTPPGPDVTAPTVSITSPTSGPTFTTSATSVTLSGSAADNIGVTQVTWTNSRGGSGTATGTTSWSAAGIALQLGTNVLTVTARDAANNVASATLTVTQDPNTPQPGLVAAYGFDEASGTTTTDASGNTNHGSFGSGVTRTATGRFGGALVFNGSSGRVTVPNAASLTLTTAMTLEAWVNPSVVSSAWRDVVYKGNDNFFLMGTTTNSSRPAGGGIFGGGSTTSAYGTAALATNTWTHLATTYDGAAVRLYVNGVQVSSTAKTGTIATSTNPLSIGGDAIYGQYFQGMIDEVRVYSRALTAGEIQTDLQVAISNAPPQDLSPPAIAITAPTNTGTYATTTTPLAVSGTASDNVGVTQVTWVNDRGGSGTASGTTAWSVSGIALQPGTNVITVTARDAANNAAPTTLTVTYTVPDNTAPTVSVTSPTSSPTYATNATSLALSGNAADNVGVTQVTWANDRGGSGTATGTTTWSAAGIALQPGANVLTVTARDAANNVATATLTVMSDAVVPTVVITSPTSEAVFGTTSTPVDIAGSASDNGSVAQVMWVNSRGGSGIASGTTTWSVSGIVLQTGDNILTVTAQDAVGNVASSTLTVTYTLVDNTAPTVTITSPTSSPTYATNATSLTLSGSAADNVGVAQVTWTSDRGGSGTAAGTAAWSATGIALQPGMNVLTVTARDAANNVATAVITVASDAVVPTVAITTPTTGATFSTTTTPIDVSGTSDDNVGVTHVTWANNRGGSGTAVGTTNWSVSGIVLQPGDNVLTVTAHDAVGNVAANALTVTYVVPDNTAPTATITSPTSGATHTTNATALTLSGSAADNVAVTQVTWENSAGGSGTATGTTSWTAANLALQPGSNVITVTAHDAAGNVGNAVLTVTSDPTAPTIAITTPATGGTYATTSTPLDISGTAADNMDVMQVTWSNNRGGSGSATGTTAWSASGIVLQAGDNVLTVTARDAAGNVATGTLTVTYTPPDNTPPTISITSPTSAPSYPTNLTAITVSGTAADNVGVTQVTWTNSAGGSGSATGTTTWSITGIALQPGSNVITVRAVDAANNPATATLTVAQDAAVPTVTITSPAAGTTVSATISVNASASDNTGVVGVQFLLDGAALGAEVTGAGPTYATTWLTTGASNGTHILAARARDAAGNTAVSPDVSVTVSNTVQPPGLVAAYGFNEASGTTTTDASGKANNGTYGSGVTRTATGRFGGALVFNGSSGRVTIPNAASLTLTTGMTLEAWVNPSVVNGAWRDVVYKGNDNFFLMGTTTNASRPAGGGIFGGGPGTTQAYGTAALAANAWTHLATTYDGAAVRLYVNGIQVSSTAKTGAIATSTNPLSIGGDAIYGQYFQGMIDEVRVYNRALTVAEIQSDMTTAVVAAPPPDTSVPTIAITSPTGTGSYTATASPLAIGGTSSDNVGVTQVTWASDRGGSGIASGTTTWSASGIVLQPGTNVIAVTARDAANNAATATLTVTFNAPDTSPPAVTITGPTSGATYATNVSSLTISGTAADNVAVTQVTWANSTGGSGGATGTTSWSAVGIALQTGPNVVTVTARDAANNFATATLTVTLDAVVPSVVLTAPSAGSTVSGMAATLTASASDNNALAGVQFLVDGTPIGAEVIGTGPTFTTSWNTRLSLNGGHVLAARARDAAGNTAVSADVPVTVSNTQPAGLVAGYGFEEVSGTTVVDASGNNNTGNFGSGVTRTTQGRLGAALQFSGGLINILNAPTLALTTGMTLEAWLNPSNVVAQWRDAVYKANDAYYLMASSTNGSRPAGGGRFNGASTTTQVDGSSALPANTWSHLAVTYDGATLRLYVNGAQVSSVARTGPITTSSSPLQIGGDSLYSQYFSGVIDEVRVYNRALSQSEIQTDMTTPLAEAVPPPTPSMVGQWGAPFTWPIVSIHASLLKTGEVLTWEYDGAGGPYLWTPSTGTFTAVTQPGNKFCAGQAALPDGRILIAGGHAGAHVGLPDLNIFDPVTRNWSQGPNMAAARWYPTVTALADGRSMVTSGETNCDGCFVAIPEIYDPVTNLITRLTSAPAVFPYYPHMFLLPDGRIFAAATSEDPIVSKALDMTTLTWSVVDPTPVDGGSSVMYLPGKIMKSGTSHNPDLAPDPSSAATYVIDMTQPSPLWQSTAPMAKPRTYHTLTVLADGSVLVTGGGITSDAVGLGGAVLSAELWSPSTQTWTTLSSASVPRLYHSVALLLPDGRVLTTGGGRFNGFPSNDASDFLNAEIFSPPYLFKGTRPAITSAPGSAAYGSLIAVQTPDAANISTVSLVKLGSVTHAINMDQRYVPLTFTPNAGSLDVQMPANANLAPPGYYMMFIVNSNGVPSVASMIRMQ